MRRFRSVIYVRPWAEMNAHWSPYLPGSSSKRAGNARTMSRVAAPVRFFPQACGRESEIRSSIRTSAANPRNTPIDRLWPRQGSDGRSRLRRRARNGRIQLGRQQTTGGDAWLEFEELFADGYRTLTALDATFTGVGL